MLLFLLNKSAYIFNHFWGLRPPPQSPRPQLTKQDLALPAASLLAYVVPSHPVPVPPIPAAETNVPPATHFAFQPPCSYMAFPSFIARIPGHTLCSGYLPHGSLSVKSSTNLLVTHPSFLENSGTLLIGLPVHPKCDLHPG